MNEASRYSSVFEFTVYWIVTSTAALLVLASHKTEVLIGKWLIIILSAFVISYIITFVLSLFIPLKRLLMMTIDYNYFYDTPVYFPFTLVYGTGKIGDFEVVRMQGFGRECGITQTFYIWAFYKCQDYFKSQNKIKVLMGLGVLFCFSTTGLVLFSISFVIGFLFKDKNEKSKKKYYILLLIIIVLILFFGGTFSLSKRIEMSYGDRIEYIKKGFEQLSLHPFWGTGFMNNPYVAEGNADLSDICLLASIGKIGIVGFLLFLAIYLVALTCSKNKKSFLQCNIGFFVTTLFAQPLFYVPLIYIMLLMDYYNSREVYKSMIPLDETRKRRLEFCNYKRMC